MAWYPRRIFQWLTNGLANPETGPQGSGPASSVGEAFDVSDERSLQIAAVWSCVRLIAETVSVLPLGFYKKTSNGREPLPSSNPLFTLLKRSPNQQMTDTEFREAMTTQLVLWGNAYARIDRIGTRPVNLVPLTPGRMAVVRQQDGSVVYHYTTDRGIDILAQQSVMHLKGFSAEGIIGFSPLALARHAFGLTVAAEQYSAGAFRNGGRPLGTLNFDTFLKPEQREAALKMYENITAGANSNAKSWVLEGGVTYTPIGIPPDDLQMLETRRFQIGEIARVFRVPSHLINDSEKATSWGSGIEQLNLGFLQYTLMPYLRRWETVIRNALMTPAEQETFIVEHNVEGLLRADSSSRASFYSTMAQNGLMTRNEIRQKENLPSMDGGDDLTVQVNLTPIEQLLKIGAGNAT